MLGSNLHGLDFTTANHASRFGRVCAQRNTHQVTVSGAHGFTIEQLNIEKAGAGQTDANNAWQATVYDLNDPNNRGIGAIDDWVVLGGTGAVDDFVINGGANIRTRRIGASSTTPPPPPPPPGPADLNGSFETPKVSTTRLVVWSHELGHGLGAAQDENSDDGDRITVTFNLSDSLLEHEPKLFFRVEEE